MGAISASIKNISLLEGTKGGAGARKIYSVLLDVAAYTGSSDTLAVAAVGAAILAANRNGKTHTLRWACPGSPGLDTAAQEIYACGGGTTVQPLVVSTDALAGVLGTNANVEVTTSTACTDVEIIVAVDES
jgi:hypothetical protein